MKKVIKMNWKKPLNKLRNIECSGVFLTPAVKTNQISVSEGYMELD